MDPTKKVIAVLSLVAIFGVAIYESKNPRGFGSQRTPAATDLQNTPHSKVMRGVTDAIKNIKTRDEILPAVREIIRQADAQGATYPGLRIAAALARVVPYLEGILWRLRPIVEPSDWLHASVLFKIRTTYYNDYLYGKHITALLDFITEPSESGDNEFLKKADQDAGFSGSRKKFTNTNRAQEWLVKVLAPQLVALDRTLGELLADPRPVREFEFEFDQTTLIGTNENGLTFIDPEDTGKKFIKPYLYTLKFLNERALMTIHYVNAVNLVQLPSVAARILASTGLNALKGFLRQNGATAKGMTPEIMYEAMRAEPSFMSYKSNPKDSLDKAFDYGKSAAENQLRGYVCGITYPQQIGQFGGPTVNDQVCETKPDVIEGQTFIAKGNDYIFDPNSMIDGFRNKYPMFHDRAEIFRKNSVGQPHSFLSNVTGKWLHLNVKAAFFDPNFPPRNFLPAKDAYESFGVAQKDSTRTPSYPGEKAWVYPHGRPALYDKAGWDMHGLFAQDSGTKDAFIFNMTNLMYTPAAAPFAAFIRFPSPVRFMISTADLLRANN